MNYLMKSGKSLQAWITNGATSSEADCKWSLYQKQMEKKNRNT